MTRPWCLVEVHTALSYGVPIVPIELEGSWPHHQHLQWPTDTELRKLCGADSALQFWLETMPVQPAEEVAKYHEALRSKLASYSRRKYNPQEAEEIRSAVEGVIVKRIAAAAQAGREAAVVFAEPETAELRARPELEPKRAGAAAGLVLPPLAGGGTSAGAAGAGGG